MLHVRTKKVCCVSSGSNMNMCEVIFNIVRPLSHCPLPLLPGLPPTGSWQDLKDHMREAGDVCFADVQRDGEGVVEFLRREDMEYALRKLDRTEFRSHQVSLGANDFWWFSPFFYVVFTTHRSKTLIPLLCRRVRPPTSECLKRGALPTGVARDPALDPGGAIHPPTTAVGLHPLASSLRPAMPCRGIARPRGGTSRSIARLHVTTGRQVTDL